jgi:uncharacterized protein YndB with AHSA1/START domain
MIDMVNEIDAVHRAVAEGRGPAGDARSLLLRRTFDSTIDDVWDALTNPERISRWFLPVTGDYRVGGRYQFEGNAGGQIVSCERPHQLHVTWGYAEMGGDAAASDLEVRLSPAGDEATIFELEHTAVVPDEMWAEYGPGAVGVGWDQGLLGLSIHLHGDNPLDPVAWPLSAEGREFLTRSSEGWGAANRAAGADEDTVARGVANTITFYVPASDGTN